MSARGEQRGECLRRLRRLLPAGLVILLAVNGRCLLSADWEGLTVKEVRHRPEEAQQQAMTSAALQDLVPQKSGEPYSSAKIRQSIERLYATGRFTDIRVDSSAADSGVILTFLTKTAYFIGSVQVRGVAAPPGEGQLRSATHFELGHLFLQDDVPVAIEGLRRVLEDDGYFQPQIVPSYQTHPDTQQIDVTFDVRAGRRARLGKVEFRENPVFPPAKLIREAKWKTGKPLTLALVQNGLERIRKLYQKEDYLTVSIAIATKKFNPGNNSADLELAINAGAQIGVTVTGASLKSSEIKKLVPVFAEGSLDEELLEEGQRNLTDYFQARGYFDVKVGRQRKDTAAGHSIIEYQIERGVRQRLEEIRITGNHYFKAEDLREHMRIAPVGFGSSYGRFSSKLLTQDLTAIRALYEKNGFSEVEVTSKLAVAEASERYFTVSIEIREGPQTRIGKFSIAGNRSFPQARLQSAINGGSGQPFSRSMIASDRDNLLTLYFDQGFPHAKFRWNESPSSDKQQTDLQYVLDEGPREDVGQIYVNGLVHTRRGIVNRELQIREGAPLSQSGLLETQRHLYDLGVFNRVEVAVQNPEGQEYDRNVLVYLEEAHRYTMKLGLGAEVGRFGGSSTDVTNVQGKTEFSPDISFELTRLNMGGRPHTASVSGRFSTLQKRGGLTYTAPRFLNHQGLEASARAFLDETRDVRTFTARRVEGALQFEEKKSKISTFLYRYSFRRVTVDTNTLNPKITGAELPILTRPVLVGMLSQVIVRDTRDNPAESHHGMFTSADLGVAASQLGSQISFARLLLQNSSYHGLGKKLVFARSTQFGVQSSFGNGRAVELQPAQNGQPAQEVITTEIPIAEHFFSGGGNSHRGFAVNQAGPRDPVTGFPLGGNALLLNSVELRFPIWRDSIGGVVFHDAGNVFTDASHISLREHQKSLTDFNYISHAAGFGLRYRTPVGPIRLDLGYNLNRPNYHIIPTVTTTKTGQTIIGPDVQGAGRWQFLFSIGQTF